MVVRERQRKESRQAYAPDRGRGVSRAYFSVPQRKCAIMSIEAMSGVMRRRQARCKVAWRSAAKQRYREGSMVRARFPPSTRPCTGKRAPLTRSAVRVVIFAAQPCSRRYRAQ